MSFWVKFWALCIDVHQWQTSLTNFVIRTYKELNSSHIKIKWAQSLYSLMNFFYMVWIGFGTEAVVFLVKIYTISIEHHLCTYLPQADKIHDRIRTRKTLSFLSSSVVMSIACIQSFLSPYIKPFSFSFLSVIIYSYLFGYR